MMQGTSVRKSHKEMDWQQRLARFSASGQAVKAFCKAEFVSESAFYRWRQRLDETNAAVAPAPRFIDVGMLPPAEPAERTKPGEPAEAALEIRLDLGRGLVLHIVRR